MAIRRRSPRATGRAAVHRPRTDGPRTGGGGARSLGRALPLLAIVLPFLLAVPAAAQPAAAAVPTTGHVALTFDDGPGDGTARVLDVLAARGVRATFFVIGDEVPRYPAEFARIVAEGHEVGNHSTSHPNLLVLLGDGGPAGVAAVRAQIADTACSASASRSGADGRPGPVAPHELADCTGRPVQSRSWTTPAPGSSTPPRASC